MEDGKEERSKMKERRREEKGGSDWEGKRRTRCGQLGRGLFVGLRVAGSPK